MNTEFCDECGCEEDDCLCYFLFSSPDFEDKPFKFEHAFESITEESSYFKVKMPEK